jgi:phospholipase C
MPKNAFCRLICTLAALAVFAVSPLHLRAQPDDNSPTTTPIKHVVVIFQENVSFDHYYGTYPLALPNNNGTRYFGQPKDDTPRVNNLVSSGLLTRNPNKANPFRIDRSVPNTCDQNHGYSAEEAAFHGGLMDMFVQQAGCTDKVLGPNSVMGYYDGNTVTALWNYAQNYAMSDDHFGTTFGPSTPGALNVVSGNTFEGTVMNGFPGSGIIANGATSGAVISDRDPYGDICSNPKSAQIQMNNKNIGDLLNEAGITWGAFMGGFTSCTVTSTGITGLTSTDYIPHHAWFQYWASTLNANHVPPSSDSMIGKSDQAKHEYDLSLFFTALKEHNLPAVSYLKAAAFEDGHAAYSDPLDEQKFLVTVLNALMQSDEWKETAVFITWDDSDGWYDHQMGPIMNQSDVAEDRLLGSGSCGTAQPIDASGTIQNGKCGFGPRIPFLVISPWAKMNYVDHRVIDFSSVVRFIEDNWSLGRIGGGSNDVYAGKLDGMFDFDDGRRAGKFFLDPLTGVLIGGGNDDDRGRDQRW